MRRPTWHGVWTTTVQVIVGLVGLWMILAATPVSAAIGGAWGIAAGGGLILLGLLLVALIQ